jgi:hypothetical protein
MIVGAGLGSTGVALVSVVSLAVGYGVLWALWHFIFSPRNDRDQ